MLKNNVYFIKENIMNKYKASERGILQGTLDILEKVEHLN